MRVRPEYAALVQVSKVGVGTQGMTDLDRLDSATDRVLVLDPDLSYYLPRFGSRCWLRIMHDGSNWKDPIGYAEHAAIQIAKAYQYGCRDVLTGNEQIALEGLGDSEEDYRWLNQWGVEHLRALRAELRGRGIHDVRVWGPALSPGHFEDDDFRGYRLLADYLRALDGIAVHNYWGPDWGFFPHADFEWWAGRIERAHALVEAEMGIVKPWAITEQNRKVNRSDPADIVRYAEEQKQYYRWVNSLDYVVACFTFLYCNTDPAFADLTWTQMPGMVKRMSDGWDRQSEGEWAMPVVGQGFQKCVELVGPWKQDEVHHWPNTPDQTSVAVGEKGYATWRAATNETVAHCDDGRIYSDFGNRGEPTGGQMVQIYPLV